MENNTDTYVQASSCLGNTQGNYKMYMYLSTRP